MTETVQTNSGLRKAAKFGLWMILAILCLLLLVAVCVRVYLASGLPAPLVSRLVTTYLHQDFTVERLQLSNGGLVLTGLRLQNPPGFPQRPLAAAQSVAVAPDLFNLLSGRQRFRLVSLHGVTINLDKNSAGAWNYGQLQGLLAARKPSAKETVIDELVVKDGALMLQGEGLQGISLQLFHLTTKGSRASNFDVAFRDPARNLYAIKGKARTGPDAALDLAITAPALSLQDTAGYLKLKDPGRFAGGSGALAMNVTLHKGAVSCLGDLSFRGVRLPAPGASPVNGSVHFDADYDLREDLLRLKKSTLTVGTLARLYAEGTATGLKSDRRFSLSVGMDDFDLGTVSMFLPEKVRRTTVIAGVVRCDRLLLEGNRARGLTSATGVLHLRDGELTREGRLLVAGLHGEIDFSRSKTAILCKGKLSVAGPPRDALLQAVDLSVAASLSPKLKPMQAEVPAFSAKVMNIPVGGRLQYDAARSRPLTASLKVPAVAVATINPLLKRFGLQGTSGTCMIALDVTGRGAQDLAGAANVQLDGFSGTLGTKKIAVGSGTVVATAQKRGGQLRAQGRARLEKVVYDGKAADARFGYQFADQTVRIEGLQGNAAGTDIAVSHLVARLPAQGASARVNGYPIDVDLAGGSVRQKRFALGGLSGRLRGSYHADSTGTWLEGTADLASPSLDWQDQKLTAAAVHATFARSGMQAAVSGKLFAGTLGGTASFNPFAVASGVGFDVALAGADLAAAARYLPKGGYRPAAGTADIRLAGSYAKREGLSCKFQSKGSGIVVVGKGDKKVVSGAGLSVAGALTRGDLTISEGVLSLSPDVALRLKGGVTQALSPQRSGSVTFSLPASAASAVVAPVVNILPRMLQEGTLSGTIAASGKVDLGAGRTLVHGSLLVKGGQLEVPVQKLSVTGIDGGIPFSIDLSGKGNKPPQTMSFSRDNFPRLLAQLKKEAGVGETFTVGRISYGNVQLGPLTMQMTAVNGLTQITSVHSALFQGEALGRGYLTVQDGIQYRGDLLIHELSLKTLCSMFPNIAGYISGRVDGVVSIGGQGKGLKDVVGFMELWAGEKKGEQMVVSKEFLQRLAKQKLAGFFFRSNRPYDRAEIKALLQEGYLTFETLTIEHTNFFGVRDLSVSIAPGQNRIALGNLLSSIQDAALRSKTKAAEKAAEKAGKTPAVQQGPAAAPEAPAPEFKWGE